MRRRIVGILLVFVSLTLVLQAQQTDPKIQAILRSSLKTMIGDARPGDIVISGTVQYIAGSQDEMGTVRLEAVFPKAARIEMKLPSGTRSEIFSAESGDKLGFWSSDDGIRHRIAPHNLLVDNAWFFPAFTIGKLLSPEDYVVTYVGQEKRNETSVEHFVATMPTQSLPKDTALAIQRLSRLDLYLDSTTLLPAFLAFNTHPDTDDSVNIPVEIQYLDYQTFGGVQTSARLQKYFNGTLNVDIRLESAALNTGISIAQ